jgi:hypothetical protein
MRGKWYYAAFVVIFTAAAAISYGQGLLTFPNWTTSTRPGLTSPGAVGFNTQTNLPEYLDNTATWKSFSTGGGGGGGGTGTVTSVTGGCGLGNTTPNPIIAAGTFNAAVPVSNTITSSPYTLQSTDACNLVVLQAGASVVTIPATSTSGFGVGNYWWLDNQSGGTVTLNVTSPSNLDGSSSVSIVNATAMAFQSDGTNYHYMVNSAPGIGTVTNVSGTCGISTTNPTSAAVVSNSLTPVVVTASNPPIVTGYCGEAVYLSNSSNQTPTIAQAGSAGFLIGWQTLLCNIGGGTQTIAPASGTIGGLSSYLLNAGAPATPVCVGIISDGTSNYDVVNGPAGTVTSVSAACGNTTGTGAITAAGTVTGLFTPTLLTGSNPSITAGYCGGVEYLQNGSNQIPTIAEAGATGFPAGWFTDLCNSGAGTQTVTPTSPGTIGGASTKVLAAGSAAAPVCIRIVSDGVSNYYVR